MARKLAELQHDNLGSFSGFSPFENTKKLSKLEKAKLEAELRQKDFIAKKDKKAAHLAAWGGAEGSSFESMFAKKRMSKLEQEIEKVKKAERELAE